MAQCTECGYDYMVTDCFCRQCGAEHPDNDDVRIFSCECGAQVFPEDNFCHACGEGFEGMEEVEEDDDEEFDDSDDDYDDDSEDDWGDDTEEESTQQQTLGY
ncbi:hypothetical protein D6774_01170 [Candidatus Woesearchaeota archaeon]|nr:MAG: hypothetical protein D6774_01170 [Candidatus Woesearchaeota archaeon]